MKDQPENTEAVTGTSASKACTCGYTRVARALIGTLLLTVMLGNLVIYASPEWAATLGSYLGGRRNCCPDRCPTTACCPEMTGIGIPVSVLESVMPSDERATEIEAKADPAK